ncbi:F-box protein PP2-B10 [Lactuca sativa]|uniref:F-box protein PP2-B10 n=1 Tax=Lactuca sativa TaxID=4236 RepID=UPI000CD98F84|nr:F-box protein PP2-B10 [Lactuca sativa]
MLHVSCETVINRFFRFPKLLDIDAKNRIKIHRGSRTTKLIYVSLLEIIDKINTSIFSPDTTYVALLVFKTTSKAYGFEYQLVDVCIGFNGDRSQTRMVYLDPEVGWRRGLRSRRGIRMFSKVGFSSWDVPFPSKENGPKQRDDGWFAIEIEEHFNGGGDAVELELRVEKVNGGSWKTGLVIQGIEFRLKKLQKL